MANGVAMDTNWDGYLTFTDAFARQEFAKHLYTLMMLVTDLKYGMTYPTIDNLPKYARHRSQPALAGADTPCRKGRPQPSRSGRTRRSARSCTPIAWPNGR